MANIWDELEKKAFEPNKKETAPSSTSVWDTLEAQAFGNEPQKSVSSNRFSAAIDQYQAGLLGAGEAVTGALGITGAEEALRERRIQNEQAAERSLAQAREQGAVESYKDVKDLSSAGSYVAGLAIQSAPYAAEALVGGLGARALMGGTRAALSAAVTGGDVIGEAAARQTLSRGSQAGAAAASYPSAVGDVLQNQRDQAGTTDLKSAAGLAIPYAALNVLGVEGTLAKGQLFRSAGSLLDDVSGVKGGLTRAGVTGVKTGAGESLSETAQEGFNQFGRMAVDPNEKFLNDKSIERFKESAVGGFVLGGAAGSLGGGWRRSEGSILPGSTDSGNLNVSDKPDNNAINKAIDGNSPEILVGPPPREALLGPQPPEQAGPPAPTPSQVQAAQQQVEVQKQQEAQDSFNQVASTYGIAPTGAGSFKLGGVLIRDQGIAQQYIQGFEAINKDKTPEQKAIFGAALSSGAAKIKPGASIKSIAQTANTFLNQWQFEGLNTKQEAADWASQQIATIEGSSAIKEAAPLNEFHKSLTGQDSPAFVTLVQQAEEKPAKATKQPKQGVENGQLQMQGNAGIREVPIQGGTTQTGGTGTGNVRPISVQPIGTTSLGEGSLGLQTGAIPSGGIPTSAGTNVAGSNLPNAVQEQTEVIEDDRVFAINEIEKMANAAFGTRDAKIIMEFIATDGAVNKAKIADKLGLSRARITQITGAPKEGESFNEQIERMAAEKWGPKLFIEGKRMGYTQADMLALFETTAKAQDEMTAETGETVNDQESEINADSPTEEIYNTNADDVNPAFSDEANYGTEIGNEELSTTDEDGGQTASGYRIFNPKVSGTSELEDASSTNRAKFSKKDISALSDSQLQNLAADEETSAEKVLQIAEELTKRQQKRVSKGNKNAVQEPSTESKTVGNKPKVSKGVRKQDTEGGKAATESKQADEESRALTVEGYFDEKAKLKARYDELQTAYDKLNTQYWDLEFKNIDDERAKVKDKLEPVVVEQELILKQLENLKVPAAKTSTALTNAQQAKVEEQAWNDLPVPVSYEQLSPQAKFDWAMTVKNGKSNLAAASKVYEDNQESIAKQLADESRTIDGTDLITEVGEEKQYLMLTNQVNKLTEAQVSRLEKHYGEERDTPYFMQNLKDDVLRYIEKGAESVAGAIRDIIRQMANGVMSMAVIFNPGFTSEPFKFAVPTYETRTTQVTEQAPAEAAKNMSPAAQRAYEVIYPTIKNELVKNDKLFIVTDKPTATNFIFSPDGKLLFQSKVLIGKTEGNYYKGNNDVIANRITPAGLYNMGMREGGKTAGDYDFNKVFGVEQVENGQKYFVTMMHSVWTKESDAAQRLAALKEAGPQNSRYSFGCVNVDKETFGKVLAGHEKQMDGAKLFIVPDGNENVMEFINGKAVYSSDMVREKAEPITKTEKVPTQGTGSTEQTLAAKEEKATEETIKLSSKSKKFYFDEIEDTERGFNSIRENLTELGIENSLDFVSDWSFVDIKDGEPGAIESIGGRYVVTVNNNAEFTDAYIAETARHEIGHAVDMAPHGGIYSAQPEMGVALKDGVITPVGAVAREMHNLYKNDSVWNDFLGYPFDAKTFTDLDTHVKIEAELFAQLFTVYTNPQGRAKLEAEAPVAAAYMKEVINDIKSSKALQIQTPRTAAERVVRFQNRNAPQRSQAPSRPIPERQEKTGVVLRNRNYKKAREQASKQIDKLPPSVAKPTHYVVDTIVNFAKSATPYAAFTEDLADMAAKYIPSVKKYVNLMKERQAIRTRLERQVDNILQDYDKLPAQVKGTGANSVNKFLMDSTRDGKWAYNPGWIKDFKEDKDIDPAMQARFEALPASAQKLVQRVFAHGQDTLKLMQKSVIENINTEYDALIAAAKKVNDLKEEQELTKKKAASLADYRTLMRINAKKPYAPLKRFGDYVVVGKSKEYLDVEKIVDDKSSAPDVKAEAAKKLRELEKNDMHYFVQFAETVGEAKAVARAEEKNYAQVEDFEKDTSHTYGGRDVNSTFHRLRNLVEENKDSKLGDASERAVNRLLADLHLTLLSEQSARQSERRRRGIGGAEKDMMRAFATQGRATASFISSLENTGNIYDILRDMKEETDSSDSPGTRGDRRKYYNEFMKRHFMGMDYRPSPFMDKALSTTSAWMLLTNPAYYLQNMTQPFMMSLPVIGARYGYARSWKEMTRAYTDIASVIKKNGLSEESYNKLPEDVRNVVEVLVNRGRIDISLEQDLGRWRSTEDAKLAKFGRATELLRSMAQDIETINRVATAVAAYRLALKGPKGNPTMATDYADSIIYSTHGDYSAFNAPRITRQGLGRLATQFRKFQLIQISLIARLYNDAFRSEDADTRLIGKKALGYTIAHTAVMGGIMGLPGFAAIAALYGMLFGDEDEPDNPELALRRAIGDDDLADLLVKGVPAALGVDVSGKIGMGQMLSILPYTDVKFTRKDLPAAGYALLTGPFGGLTLKGADAVNYIGAGDYQKGLEQLLPSGLGNILKAERYASEGITTRSGDVVMKPEDIGAIDAFMVALGLPTKPITDRNFLNAAKFQYDEFYNEKASEIKRAYVDAYKEGDNEGLGEARTEWNKLQESRTKNGYTKQPLSTLLKAPQEQKKRERNVTGGVQFNKANRGFVQKTSEL